MITIAKADKSRLTIRGLEDGQFYAVADQPGGWFVSPERTARPQRKGLSPEAFAKLWSERQALDAETAAEVLNNIRKTREIEDASAA